MCSYLHALFAVEEDLHMLVMLLLPEHCMLLATLVSSTLMNRRR